MRVISGEKKGFKLKAPKGKDTRPTEDRIKESMFNILKNINDNSLVLDLFAGSGSIGIEFLSRGAKKAYFVDKSNFSIAAIKENLNHTGLLGKSKIIKNDSIKAIKLLARKDIKFHYIFVDPPYERDIIKKVIENIWRENILAKDGLIILEHEKKLELPNWIQGLEKVDERNYGSKSLTFYTYNKEV